MTARNFVERYEDALATQDWARVAPLIAEEACVVFSDGSRHAGKAAIRSAYERNFSAIKGEVFRIESLRWLVETPTSAAYMFDFSWAGEINGRPASGAGRGTAVLRCEAGEWVLVGEQLGPKV